MSDIYTSLSQLYDGKSLSQEQARELFSLVVQGKLDDAVLAALLVALKIKGETPEEIAGGAGALIDNAAAFPRPDGIFADIVGTGGDGHDTINISSASAVVAASCGLKVAKHGNRSVSSRSGSADLFREFGVRLDMPAQTARRCLDKSHFCFLHAPVYHAGIRHAMPVRTALKTRTLFNILGPQANPAKPTHMMVGVYTEALVLPYAKALQLLGYEHALVVHGSGLDELALHGYSSCVEVRKGELLEYQLHPRDFNLPLTPIDDIKGGSPEENRKLIESVLKGQGKDAHQNAVAMNAGALLHFTGYASSWEHGASMAVNAMMRGAPFETITYSAALSQE